MNTSKKTLLIAGTFLAVATAVSADPLTLNTFQAAGGGASSITGASTGGASIEYLADSRHDRGLAAAVNTGTPATFAEIGDTLTYSFNLSGISGTIPNALTPIFFTGFDFGDTAVLRYGTSTGSQVNLNFASNTTGNPFSSGVTHSTVSDWSDFDLQDLRFREGSNIDAVVTLELLSINSPTSYDYKMTVSYQSTVTATDFNSAEYIYTGVNGNEVRSIFHVSNISSLGEGVTYTISDASLSMIPESNSFALMGGVAALGLVLSRRR